MEGSTARVPAMPAASLKAMQVMVVGRLNKSRVHEGKRYSHVLIPAADSYSRPQQVEIRSSSKLGENGDDVRVLCVVGGYGKRPYRFTDKDTGETRMIEPVTLTLDAVEG